MMDYSLPIISRFLKYVSYPTNSEEDVDTVPSTPKQFALAHELVKELKELGLEDAFVDEHCYVYATLPANVENDVKAPSIGFIAHMDTSSDASDYPIAALCVEYDGQPILLNENKQIYLDAGQFPELNCYVGKHLIVTDGTTLLGGDDKCGIAEIMTALSHIIDNNVPHKTIYVSFNPDEEVGMGSSLFDLKRFCPDFAYTIDGLTAGELEYENFNAATATLDFSGVNVHPGSAKGRMINAARVATEFAGMIPQEEIPEKTEGYEGFYHLIYMNGETEHAKLQYLVRDHDRVLFEKRKRFIQSLIDLTNEKYGDGTVTGKIIDSYYNMKEVLEQHPEAIHRALDAMNTIGMQPIVQPIRGGTDGAMISLKGLPCPNLGTGTHNAHSRYEFACIEEMVATVELICEIVRV